MRWETKEFIYENDCNSCIGEEKLVNLLCKHVCSLDSAIAKGVYTDTLKLGYDCRWGAKSGNLELEHHLANIIKQETDGYNGAVRLVITKGFGFYDNIVWADNLHSTIRYIRKLGFNTKVSDIPYYVVDLSGEKVIIRDLLNVVRKNESDIRGAIESAHNRAKFSNKRIINYDYKVGSFLNDNITLLPYRFFYS